MINEEKREKFLSLAESRVQNVIHSMEIIMPMGNSSNYDYSEADVDLMINAIREKTDDLETALKERFSKAKLAEKKLFSFSMEKTDDDTKEEKLDEI